jgi:hypothetical protein
MSYVLKSKAHPAFRTDPENPGSLLASRVQLLQGGVSKCRNKSLQLMFQLMGGGGGSGGRQRDQWPHAGNHR